MEINFTSKRGKSTVSTSVEVEDLKSEENLQTVFIHFVDFLSTLGAEFPDEIIDILEQYDD